MVAAPVGEVTPAEVMRVARYIEKRIKKKFWKKRTGKKVRKIPFQELLITSAASLLPRPRVR